MRENMYQGKNLSNVQYFCQMIFGVCSIKMLTQFIVTAQGNYIFETFNSIDHNSKYRIWYHTLKFETCSHKMRGKSPGKNRRYGQFKQPKKEKKRKQRSLLWQCRYWGFSIVRAANRVKCFPLCLHQDSHP